MFAQPVQCSMHRICKSTHHQNDLFTMLLGEAVMTTSFEGVGVQFVFDTMTAHIVRLM